MSLKYLAAFALASLSTPHPTKEDVEKICASVGIACNAADLAFVLEAIDGRDVSTLIAEGAKKMASAPAAGGSAAAPAAGAAAAAAPAAAKEEKVEEEDDDEMGFGLFD